MAQGRNPYSELPDLCFWGRTMSAGAKAPFDPVVQAPFQISRGQSIATAGSCFAQHIAKYLVSSGHDFIKAEEPGEDSPIFSARFGNIYTVRQLLQLLQQAMGTVEFHDHWLNGAGRVIDPHRPQEFKNGFDDLPSMLAERSRHLAAVRRMFETCDIFVFTLGLTQGWVSEQSGAVVPLAPGIVGGPADTDTYAFYNFEVDEIVADLRQFITDIRRLNPKVKIILTVSPVPLKATYVQEHVLVSNTVSKARLRVAADIVCRETKDVAYFPSYEIVTSGQGGRSRYEADLRSVAPTAVAEVMSLFGTHFLKEVPEAPNVAAKPAKPLFSFDDSEELQSIICDEDLLDPARGS